MGLEAGLCFRKSRRTVGLGLRCGGSTGSTRHIDSVSGETNARAEQEPTDHLVDESVCWSQASRGPPQAPQSAYQELSYDTHLFLLGTKTQSGVRNENTPAGQ